MLGTRPFRCVAFFACRNGTEHEHQKVKRGKKIFRFVELFLGNLQCTDANCNDAD